MATAVPAPTSLSRKFFVFFDFANNNPKGVAKAKEAALHFLDTNILPGDEVGLMSYSTVKGLSIHEYLTADARKVREAVDALSAKGLSGRADDVEQTFGSRFSRDIFSQGDVQQNSNLIFKDESVTGLASLTRLAVATGGKYFGNINEYGRNMDLLQDLTRSNFVYFDAAPSKTRDKLGWTDAYAFDRTRYSPIIAAPPAGASKIYASLPCAATGLVAPDIALSAFLVQSSTGEAIPLPLTVLSRTGTGTTEQRFLEISLAGIPAGRYRLYLHAEDAASKSVAYVQTALTLTRAPGD